MTPHGSCPGCAPVTATCKREVNIWYINPHQRKHTHTSTLTNLQNVQQTNNTSFSSPFFCCFQPWRNNILSGLQTLYRLNVRCNAQNKHTFIWINTLASTRVFDLSPEVLAQEPSLLDLHILTTELAQQDRQRKLLCQCSRQSFQF